MVNFQLTLILITILSIPALILFGLGILGFIYVGIIGFVMPIINASIIANNSIFRTLHLRQKIARPGGWPSN